MIATFPFPCCDNHGSRDGGLPWSKSTDEDKTVLHNPITIVISRSHVATEHVKCGWFKLRSAIHVTYTSNFEELVRKKEF